MPNQDLILLALSEDSTLQLIQRALSSASYRTVIAANRAILEKTIFKTVPAIILLGEHFDNTSGIIIASEILERFPSMPILIYAERESSSLYKEILQTGLSGCLCPPLRNNEIIDIVKRSVMRARNLGDWLRSEVRRTTSSLERRATLSESELKRYELLFANIQDGVVILDDNGQIQLINKAMEMAFDLSRKVTNGKLITDVIKHPDMNSLLERAQMVPLKYHEINFEDGRVYNAQYNPINNFGSVITMQDISYLKQLDRMKNEFVHTVSHDLRSPLTSVLGYTELIERTGSLSEQQIEFLGRIRMSVKSITSLVNDLLDLSRLEAGFDMRREVVNLENILKFAINTMESQLRLNDLSLQLNIDKELPELRGNPLRLRQLLDNLLGNAAKYSPKGATIHISLEAEEDQIILSITDEGAGIPQVEQTRIFEKFYRGSNVPEDVDGSGLGLAIVKSIVEDHKGRIWVESAMGKGSTFCVVLPANKQENISEPGENLDQG